MAKKQQSKTAKLAEAKRLFKKLYREAITEADTTMVDLRKVYVKKRTLSGMWQVILDDYEALGLCERDLRHFPASWLTGKGQHQIDEDDFSSGALAENDNCYIFNGSDLVKMLDKLKASLGPEPEKSLVMSTYTGYDLVALEDISATQLDKCVKLLRDSVEDEENRAEQDKLRAEQYEKQVRLGELVRKMGMEKAIALLEGVKKGKK